MSIITFPLCLLPSNSNSPSNSQINPPQCSNLKQRQSRLSFQVFHQTQFCNLQYSSTMLSSLGENLGFKGNLVHSPEYPCLIRFISTDFIPKNNSFKISCLVSSCVQRKRRSSSKSPSDPDSVITLFRTNGFSPYQISKITTSCPELLVSSVDKSVKPKFDFFISNGFSGSDIARILCRRPDVLDYSLEETIIPFVNLVKSIVGTDAKVVTVFKRCKDGVIDAKVLEANVSLLRERDVPAYNIARFLIFHPWLLMKNNIRFCKTVEKVVGMKVDPSEYRFLVAVQVLDAMSRSTLEAKFAVYMSWGLSLEQVKYAFRMSPICMFLSEKNIMSKMDYFVNKLGYTPSSLAKQPSSLLYSFERIVPRCSVIQLLITKKQLKKVPSLYSYLQLTEESFFEKYVNKFEKEVPEVLSTYQGKGKMIGLDSSSVIGSPREREVIAEFDNYVK